MKKNYENLSYLALSYSSLKSIRTSQILAIAILLVSFQLKSDAKSNCADARLDKPGNCWHNKSEPAFFNLEMYSNSMQTLPSANCSSTSAGCNGAKTGSATISVVGGVGPYTYIWNIGATTSTINNLAAGTYTATVTDSQSNTATCSVVVYIGSSLSVTCTGTNITCNGSKTGVALISASGGTQPYTYLWNNGSTTDLLFNQYAGTYIGTVTDDKV